MSGYTLIYFEGNTILNNSFLTSIYIEAETQEIKCTNLKEEVYKIMTNAWGMYSRKKC